MIEKTKFWTFISHLFCELSKVIVINFLALLWSLKDFGFTTFFHLSRLLSHLLLLFLECILSNHLWSCLRPPPFTSFFPFIFHILITEGMACDPLEFFTYIMRIVHTRFLVDTLQLFDSCSSVHFVFPKSSHTSVRIIFVKNKISVVHFYF